MHSGNRWISWPLMREGLKQFWYIPVLLFIAYFMTGLFPLMMFDPAGSVAVTCLKNNNLGFFTNIGGFSIIAGCIATRMWHGQAQTFSVVSQPYSRSKIFNTNILMGWLMLIGPVLLMAVIYLVLTPFMKVVPEGMDLAYGPVLQDIAMVQAYSIADVLKWFLETTALYTYMYSICVLAGAFTGTTLMAVILCAFNMAIIPTVIVTGIAYADQYLVGYSNAGDIPLRLISGCNPLIGKLLTEVGDYVPMFGTVARSVLYILAGLVILSFSRDVFRKAKLERTGDHILSKRAEALITAILTFEGATLLGLILGLGFSSKAAMIVGNVLGAVLTWFIVKVILVRTVKVFKKEHLVPLVAGAVCAAVFVAVFMGGLFGFSSRVPKAADVEGITQDSVLYSQDTSVYDDLGRYMDSNRIIRDEEYIAKVTAIHEYIVDNKLVTDNYDGDITLQLKYILKSGGRMERFFHVKSDDKLRAMLQDLVNSEQYKARYLIPVEIMNEVKRAEISLDASYMDEASAQGVYDFYMTIQDKETIRQIIDAYNQSVRNKSIVVSDWSDEDAYTEPYEVHWMNIELVYEAGAPGEYGDGYININTNNADPELAAFMAELYKAQN
ncbi:MAG: hypothetical protein IJT40_01070 [Firmicutes bacterium]|nr:hypothetical protein [Bacillota bacterium]